MGANISECSQWFLARIVVFNSLTAQLIIILIRLSIDSILYNIMHEPLGIENDLRYL